MLDKNDAFLADLDADWDELPEKVRDDLIADVEEETADEDFETPSMDDVGSYDFDNGNVMDMSKIPMEFLHFPEETPEEFLKGREQNAMMDGEPMPEPEPMPEQQLTQRLFPFGRLRDRCPPGEHFCEEEGECVPNKAEELPPCPPGHVLNEVGQCEQVVSDADIPKLKANQGERVHHVANSTMNNRPKEVGPITMMDTSPNEMPSLWFGNKEIWQERQKALHEILEKLQFVW